MPLTTRQQEFLDAYVRKHSIKGRGKKKRGENFGKKRQELVDLLAQLDPSSVDHSSFKVALGNIDKTAEGLHFNKASTMVEEVMPRVQRAIEDFARRPKDVQPERPRWSESLYREARGKALLKKEIGEQNQFHLHPLMVNTAAQIDRAIEQADKRWKDVKTQEEANEVVSFLERAGNAVVEYRKTTHRAIFDANELIAAAEKGLRKLVGERGQESQLLDLSALTQKISDARTALDTAQNAKAVPEAAAMVLGWEAELKRLAKGQKKPIEALSEYSQACRALNDQLAQAVKLRGATSDPVMMNLIATARQDMQSTDLMVAQAGTVKSVEEAIQKLKAHKDLLDKAQKREKALKAQTEVDLKALPKYKAAFDLLRRERDRVAAMPGAATQLAEIEKLLAQTTTLGDGAPLGGYPEALTALQKAGPQLVKDAELASSEFLKQRFVQLPGLEDALRETRDQLVRYGNVHPASQLPAQEEAMARAASGPNPAQALAALTKSLKEAADRQRELERQLLQARTLMDGKLEALRQAGAPQDVLNGLRNTEAIDQLRSANEMRRALDLAERANKAADDYLNGLEVLRQEWATLRRSLEAAIVACGGWAKWPTLAMTANDIRITAGQCIDRSGDDLRESVAVARRVVARYEEARKLATSLNLDGVDLSGYARVQQDLEGQWNEERRLTLAALGELSLDLRQHGAGASADKTPLHTELSLIEQQWARVMGQPAIQRGEDPGEVLRQQAEAPLTACRELAARVRKSITDDGLHTPLVNAAKLQDAAAAQQTAWREIDAMLGELLSLGVDVSAFRARLGVFDAGTAAGQMDAWGLLRGEVDTALADKQREILNTQQAAEKQVTTLYDKVHSLRTRGDRAPFPGFFESLDDRMDDVRAQLASGDPNLIQAALQQVEELSAMFKDAREGGEGVRQKSFDEVYALWTELSAMLGKDNLVAERLPATKTRLDALLAQAIEKAKRLPPEQGYDSLHELRAPVETACEEAKLLDARYKIFKVRMEQVGLRLEKLQAYTATAYTEKTKAYNERFAGLLAAAKSTAKQEGKLEEGFAQLNDLDKEVSEMLAMGPDAAREKLQQLDGEAAQEQRELRDLCRVWEQTRAYWSDKLLPAVESALDQRGQKDRSEFGNLKDAVSHAGKPISSYLDLISSVPHERWLANGSPDMKLARSSFANCHKRLRDLEKVATRMIGGEGSTNVELQTNLRKLEDEWVARVGRVRVALGSLASAIAGLPAKVSNVESDGNFYLAPERVEPFKTHASQLAKRLPAMAEAFSDSAFSAPLAVLRDSGASAAARLKAREDTLRTMRALRDNITKDKLFESLFESEAAEHFGVDVRNEVALLRGSLKKIELAVLVAV